MDELRYFDPKQDYSVAWKTLPHWAQAGAISFITWRTLDSLPITAQKEITAKRQEALANAGLNPDADWQLQLESLPYRDRGRVQWRLFKIWDQNLDKRGGACHLAKPEVSEIVQNSLRHFDVDRYLLTDFVVMPNHVHVLVAFRNDDLLLAQCTSWKRFTSTQINRLLGLKGDFWQPEQFDHLVRSPEQFAHYRRYIADNPMKANLPDVAYRHYSKPL